MENKTVLRSIRIQHTDISMKMDTTLIEMDYEDYTSDGMTHNQAIGMIAIEWVMTHEEVNNIIQPFLHKMNDIDHTGDLGDII